MATTRLEINSEDIMKVGICLRKKLVVLFICSLTMVTACAQEDPSFDEEKVELLYELEDKENEIKDLTQRIDDLEKEMADSRKGVEHFAHIGNQSREFVQAHTTGDKEKLRELLSENIILEDRDNDLYAVFDGMEWFLHRGAGERQIVFDDWVIQGYDYESKGNTINIFIREFYTDPNGEPTSPPTFLHLKFEMVNNECKIVSFGFYV